MRGRKSKQESRAEELRGKLAVWNQTTESARPSLRRLARELGTSHQLLSHLLERSEKWQSNEYSRQAEEIRARAVAENRALKASEEQQINYCVQQASAWRFAAFLNAEYRKLRRQARRDQLSADSVKMLTYCARRGDQQALEILEMSIIFGRCVGRRRT
jgi:hypothetical protein